MPTVQTVFHFNGKDAHVFVDHEKHVVNSAEDCNYALNLDQVLFNTEENKVVQVVERFIRLIPGHIKTSNQTVYGFNKKGVPKRMFRPCDRSLPNFVVATKLALKSSDSYAVIKLLKWTSGNTPTGCIEQLIGDVGDYEAEQRFIKAKYDVSKIKEKRFKVDLDKIDKIDLTPDRIDFTKKTVVSVDPVGCRDMDDALHACNLDNNTVEIGVHIADVTSYIEPGSDLDKEVLNRAQSVYLKNEQVNMLPERLAVDLCSLVEDQKRRAFSVVFKMDKSTAEIVDTRFVKSWIVNSKAFSYDEADEVVKSGKSDKNDNTDVLTKTLKLLFNTGRLLDNDNSNYDAHVMIERFMCMTNSEVAKKIFSSGADKALMRVCGGTKMIKGGSDDLSVAVSKANLCKLEGAKYVVCGNNTVDTTHGPLGYKYYTHFTSPIRRAADMIVHRQLISVCGSLYSSMYRTDQCLVDRLNTVNKNARYAEEESRLLEVVSKIYRLHESVFRSTGYVVVIDDNKIRLWVPELKTCLTSVVVSEEIKEVEDYESDSDSMTYRGVNVKLFDKVDISVVVVLKCAEVKKKLKVVLECFV